MCRGSEWGNGCAEGVGWGGGGGREEVFHVRNCKYKWFFFTFLRGVREKMHSMYNYHNKGC